MRGGCAKFAVLEVRRGTADRLLTRAARNEMPDRLLTRADRDEMPHRSLARADRDEPRPNGVAEPIGCGAVAPHEYQTNGQLRRRPPRPLLKSGPFPSAC